MVPGCLSGRTKTPKVFLKMFLAAALLRTIFVWFLQSITVYSPFYLLLYCWGFAAAPLLGS